MKNIREIIPIINPFEDVECTDHCLCAEDSLSVVKSSMMLLGRDGRPVQRTRRRFSIRETSKQIKS